MIPHVSRGILPALLFSALCGCSEAKSRAEQSSDSASPTVERPPVAKVTDSSGSRVSVPGSSNTATEAGPADVVKRYYDAIAAGHYDTAYALWEGSGKASGQTLAEFENGFKRTERTTAAIGDDVHLEGAAGSQYATVPVTVEALLRGGERQHFTGAYTLRRAMVDGATPQQRTWHIYSAHLTQR